MFATKKAITKVNSANRTVIFIDWLSSENRRAWRIDFKIVSRVKNTDAFLSMLSINTKVNTSGILISKRIRHTINIINDKRDKNRWLIDINYYQNFSGDSLVQVKAVDVAKWRQNLTQPIFSFPLAQNSISFMQMTKIFLPFILAKRKLAFDQEEMEKIGYVKFCLHLATSTAFTCTRLSPLKFW